MSCLLPQFKCLPDSFALTFKSHHHFATRLSKGRDPVYIRTQCILSTASPVASASTVIDIEKLQLPSLEANSNSTTDGSWKPHDPSTTMTAVLDMDKLKLLSLDANSNTISESRPWTYTRAPGPSMETNIGATFATDNLITSEEAVIAAAAAEAVALAKAAVQVAKDAAMMVSHDNFTKSGDDTEPTSEELELPQAQLAANITVRSSRQKERKARRARATERVAANVVSVKAGSSGKKKRSSIQDVGYADPLRYLRGTTISSRLLTATEVQELSEGIQDLLKLERLHDELAERYGKLPTFTQWAAAAGTDQKTLRKRINYGILCKDKMIKSNIRLVISIAKNYQGAGMNLQDLVQEGCRGLVRGAEKFDASKGFKFSTYAHWWIKHSVRKSLSDQSRTIRLPFHIVDSTYKVKEARKQLYTKHGRHPDDEEVAEAAGLTMKRLSTVMLTPKAPRSLDQKIGINQNLKPSEVIADPDAATSEELLIRQLMKEDLEKVLDSLRTREKQVIRWRFGLDDGRMKTLQEIGELMGVSRERIRQIESCSFRKLKNKRRTKHLQQYLIS